MAKNRALSKHSRAARRETSPSINTDKSLKDIPLPSGNSKKLSSVLSASAPGGVHKRQKKKVLTRQQKQRQQKGVERAGIVNDQIEKKVAESLKRAKVIKARAAAWEELKVPERSNNPYEGLSKLVKAVERNPRGADGGEEMEIEKAVKSSTTPAAATSSTTAPTNAQADAQLAPETVPLPGIAEEEDEIL